jgi:hypothetical protein
MKTALDEVGFQLDGRLMMLEAELSELNRRVTSLEESPAAEDAWLARNASDESHAVEKVRAWLEPLLAGGLSAARSAPIGETAERLAETILIGLENTIHGRPTWASVPGDTSAPHRPT